MHIRTHLSYARTHTHPLTPAPTHRHTCYLFVCSYVLVVSTCSSHCRSPFSLFYVRACVSSFVVFLLQSEHTHTHTQASTKKERRLSKRTPTTKGKTIKNLTINLKMQLQTKLANWPICIRFNYIHI